MSAYTYRIVHEETGEPGDFTVTRLDTGFIHVRGCGGANFQFQDSNFEAWQRGPIGRPDGSIRWDYTGGPYLIIRSDNTMATAKSKVLELDWPEIDEVLRSHAAERVLLMGPPGTGKTWAGCHPPYGRDVFQVTLTDETPAAELRGHYVPVGNEFRWHDGPAIAAWRAGGRLVLNEIDHASPDCMIFLHAILDDFEFAKLTLPTLEVVKPKTGFSVVATMNAETPDVLNEALADRFAVKILVQDVHPNAIKALPKDLQDAALLMANVKESQRRVGLRSWKAFAALRAELKNNDLAGKAVFGAKWGDIKTALALKDAGKRTTV